jgi:mono/diheme cytochrome c family protein
MKNQIIIVSTLLLLSASVGCSDNKNNDSNNREPAKAGPAAPVAPAPTPQPVAAPTPSVSAAVVAYEMPPGSTKLFNERCSLCHGKGGKGDGLGATGMKPPPRNWTDSTWQASVTDEHIATTIVKGGAGVGKSSTMPASPDLDGNFKKPIVDGLVHIVRSFNASTVAP